MGKLLYWFSYLIMNIYFKFFLRWEVRGKENLPESGPLIVMANHISNLDPPIIGCILNRQVHFMAKKELFENSVLAWFFKSIGVFPVRRGKPDLSAIKKAFKVLNEGKVLGLFPEGTRHKEGKPGKARKGAVLIALKTGSPILPVGIKNANNKKRLKVSIGKPFTLDKYYDKKINRDQKDEVAELIMDKIKKQIFLLNREDFED